MGLPAGVKLGPLRALVAITSVLALVAPGCSRSVELPGRQLRDVGRLAAGRFAAGPAACRLVSIEEVEVAVNVAVAETPSLARPILVGMDMCALARPSAAATPGRGPAMAPDVPAAAGWGVLSNQAARAFERYASWQGDHVENLEVSGHDALWDSRMRTLVVLVEHRVFGIRLSAPDPVLRSGQGRAAYFRQTAVSLAQAALQRL